jgi:Major Facilitator Superfamily.
VTAICWSIAPFVDYLPLLLVAALAGLFVVPTFSIIRQAVMAAVPESDRRTALSLDSVAVEVSFMVGPIVGVWAATVWPTAWVLFVIEMLGVLAGVGLWAANPAMRPDRGDDDGEGDGGEKLPRRAWFRPQFLAMCAAGAASTIVLSGSDIAFVAALRDFGMVSLLGPVLAIWGFGSVMGGLVYGMLRRSIPAFLLLGGSVWRPSRSPLPQAFGRSPSWVSWRGCSAHQQSPRRWTSSAGSCPTQPGERRSGGTAPP